MDGGLSARVAEGPRDAGQVEELMRRLDAMVGLAAGGRSTFWAITGFGVLALGGILTLMPRTALAIR